MLKAFFLRREKQFGTGNTAEVFRQPWTWNRQVYIVSCMWGNPAA
jgi:hypothetical protein